MQTILGANGTIGSVLAKELTNYTDKIRLVSRNPKKGESILMNFFRLIFQIRELSIRLLQVLMLFILLSDSIIS